MRYILSLSTFLLHRSNIHDTRIHLLQIITAYTYIVTENMSGILAMDVFLTNDIMQASNTASLLRRVSMVTLNLPNKVMNDRFLLTQMALVH